VRYEERGQGYRDVENIGKYSMGSLFSRGEPGCEGARTLGTLLDGWRRALVVGHLPVRDSMKGTLGGGLSYRGLKWLGCEVNHCHPNSAEVLECSCSSIFPLHAFMMWTGKA
jgi:hypothetical protein